MVIVSTFVEWKQIKNVWTKMDIFWELAFQEKQAMWGFEPADSAIFAKDFFLEKGIKNILIPGIGYGRNAKIFLENGIAVTGIEISETAIALAQKAGLTVPVYHGSVTDMPFNDQHYGGIYCYALIHLLNEPERKKFISDCYNQLEDGGYMFFVTVSKKDPICGRSRPLGNDTFETQAGVRLFFYDKNSIEQEFGQYGLMEFWEIEEEMKFKENHPSMIFTLIKCRK
ncbi:MAG: class I SAM-dependent methyltransferase [Bacteroidales bacterium]|jgi:SAM-dependent methyltransferase|nr:class I SAM-dependent methyltransferase [Bacteroidales bacterium]